MTTKDLFPFIYAGKTYKKGPPFVRRVVGEILGSRHLDRSKKFTYAQWKILNPLSYKLSKERHLVQHVVGVVNFNIGFEAHPGCHIKVGRKPLKEDAGFIKRKASRRRRTGPRKYSMNKAEMIRQMVKLVGDLRTDDKKKITTMNEWRDTHAGSQRAATEAKIQWIVAMRLKFEGIPDSKKEAKR